MKTYRLLRIVEYVGDLEWIRYQVGQSINGEKIVPPSEGYNNYPSMKRPNHGGGTIRVATLGLVPELLEENRELPEHLKEEIL